MSETIPLNHPREPKKSCMDFDRAEESLKKARAVNKELRDWGRKEAEELDRLKKENERLRAEIYHLSWVAGYVKQVPIEEVSSEWSPTREDIDEFLRDDRKRPKP